MKVTVYTSKGCAYCKMLKSFLKEKGVKYEEKLIDEDDAAREEVVKLSEGQMGTPFSVIKTDEGKTEKIVGFDKGKFEEVLGL